MVDINAAARIAEEFLTNYFQLQDDVIVVFDPEETPDYWVFHYNSRRFVETGDLTYSIVEGHPIAISKHDGSIA